jgi:hypothetical protein
MNTSQGYSSSAPPPKYDQLPTMYRTEESSRAISRSPSASSLETPVTKKIFSDSVYADGSPQIRNERNNLESYPNEYRISETVVKRKSNKSLLSTEKAAVVAMLTLKNNSSEDSDESTVASFGTVNPRSRNDVSCFEESTEATRFTIDHATATLGGYDSCSNSLDDEIATGTASTCSVQQNVQPIIFNLQNVSSAMAV